MNRELGMKTIVALTWMTLVATFSVAARARTELQTCLQCCSPIYSQTLNRAWPGQRCASIDLTAAGAGGVVDDSVPRRPSLI